MTGPDEIRDEDEVEPTEARLRQNRPLPAEWYRDDLRRRLLRHGISAPAEVRRLIAVYATVGALLLVVAGIGLAGGGPLAA